MSGTFDIVDMKDLGQAWPDIRRLFLELVDYERPLQRIDLRPAWEPRFRARLEEQRSNGFILLAHSAGAGIGFMNGALDDSNLFVAPRGYVSYASVTKDWRGKGVGQALLGRVEEWCRAKAVEEIWLDALAANTAAVGAWESMGFETRSRGLRKRVT